MATGFRGGFGNTLVTENLMKDPESQASLSECLRLSVGQAHRNLQAGIPEARNFRRSNYFGQAHRHAGPGGERRREPPTMTTPEQEIEMRRRSGR